jgi:hypothetical protein
MPRRVLISEATFDRIAAGVRTAENLSRQIGHRADPTGSLLPNVRVRIASKELANLPRHFWGRFCTRNLTQPDVDHFDAWMDNDRCLVHALNSEDLYYGCHYDGAVAGNESPTIGGYAVVEVTAGRKDDRCSPPACDVTGCPFGAAPEYNLVVPGMAYDLAVEEFGSLIGDWSLRYAGEDKWQYLTIGPWTLTNYGGTWELVGYGSTGKFVRFVGVGDSLCASGGTLTYDSSDGVWDTDQVPTLTLTRNGPEKDPSLDCGPESGSSGTGSGKPGPPGKTMGYFCIPLTTYFCDDAGLHEIVTYAVVTATVEHGTIKFGVSYSDDPC